MEEGVERLLGVRGQSWNVCSKCLPYMTEISCMHQEIATVWFLKPDQKITVPIDMSSVDGGILMRFFSMKEELQALVGV